VFYLPLMKISAFILLFYMNILRSITCICLLIIYSAASAQYDSSVCHCADPDHSAPAGIFNDHIHAKKEWMLSYRYMLMHMKGNQQGRTKLSQDQVYNNYIMAPTRMYMQMHMLMLMYGLSDKITLMGMSSFAVNTMDMSMMESGNPSHVHTGNDGHAKFSSETSGITDTKIYAVYELFSSERSNLVLSGGINLPTGKNSVRSSSMTGENDKLPYIMQPGTGNFAILSGITYTWQRDISGGLQLSSVLRTGKNKMNYRWGHEGNISGWISHRWNEWFNSSLRADLTACERISGFDPEIAIQRSIDPAADINNYGGSRAAMYGGVSILLPSGILEGLRISAEYGLPFYQNLNGVQMTLRSTLYTSIQYGF
jgi:hypothetical protein